MTASVVERAVTEKTQPEVTWGPRCSCGSPTDLIHRHGTSRNGTHLAIPRPRLHR